MNPLWDVLREAGHAALGMLALPFLYMAILFAWWHAKQASTLQRRLFHVRLHASLVVALQRTGAGIAVGLLISLLGLGVGARLDQQTLACVWAAMIVLALVRLRYICIAYAAGALGVVQCAMTWAGVSETDGAVVKALLGIDVPGLLLLAGLLHVAEGLLVRWQGARFAMPLFLEGKRGKPVGAYALSGVWPVPLLWLLPAAGSGGGFDLPWTPLSGLLGGGASVAAWSFAAFPVLLGFSDRTETRWPESKARDTGGSLIAYGVVVAALAAGSWYWKPLTIAAALAAFALHEGLLLWGRWREAGRQPVYVQDGRGLTVLAVLPGTPAAEMGLMPGERIVKANGAKVRSKEQLHDALQLQSAFCRLEVANREGHVKFVQRARYEGEHHQLGLILAPDEEADWVAAPRAASVWQGLQRAGARRRRNAPALPARAAAAPAGAASGASEEAAAIEEGAGVLALAAQPDGEATERSALAGAASAREDAVRELPAGLPPRGSKK
ncbi:PDZ domain-containing protein [Cohnella zeiphila]|uniref:PDZ domain-containing protein n=1 Tax=Cohnella zeiphila TaxID=2761120 RepID=A0A7X0SLN2_9BACL|nr:PDZ domain-containing protein [Cohnella zeiphila]MBB6732211.1 PDZ domain-containing protein [Cohnella zeiphila]